MRLKMLMTCSKDKLKNICITSPGYISREGNTIASIPLSRDDR